MRCFEASARLGGFAAAAEELAVTPGAVSQQVKALEQWVGAPLFERRSQGVSLTPLGAKARDGFTEAFDALGGALHGLRSDAGQGAVNIAALPCIAQLWLSPRLPAVRRGQLAPRISVTAIETAPNLMREIFDFSLFLDHPTGDPSERIMAQDEIFPVCAPKVAARLSQPADLARETLIHDATWAEDWPQWLARHGVQGVSSDGPGFSLYSIAVDEACNGGGVMMAHGFLVQRHLASGALVAPFEGAVATGKALIARVPGGGAPQGRIREILQALASAQV
ncbi:MAG: LysR family transcriptional regulator [Sulfitobacter sp.]